MKNYIALLFSLFLVGQLSAQKSFNIGAFKVKKIDFSLGYETDMVNGLNYQYFVDQMPLAQQGLFKSSDFNPQSLYGGICENPSISLGLTFQHAKLPNFEWRNSLAFKADRVDAVSYYSNDYFGGDFVNFNSRHNEFTAESALLYKLPVTRFLNIYGGVGTNLGFTPKNETCVFSSIDFNVVDDLNYGNIGEVNQQASNGEYGEFHACYQTGAQMNQRAFLQGGIGLKFFNKIELGIDLKYGYGYRTDFQNDAIGTNIIATNLSMRYILND